MWIQRFSLTSDEPKLTTQNQECTKALLYSPAASLTITEELTAPLTTFALRIRLFKNENSVARFFTM